MVISKLPPVTISSEETQAKRSNLVLQNEERGDGIDFGRSSTECTVESDVARSGALRRVRVHHDVVHLNVIRFGACMRIFNCRQLQQRGTKETELPKLKLHVPQDDQMVA